MAWLQWVLPCIPDWTCELIIYMDEHHHHHWKTWASGAAPGHARGRWRSWNGRDWARVPGEANLMFHYSEYTIRGWLTITPATEEGGTHLARAWHPLKGFKHGLAMLQDDQPSKEEMSGCWWAALEHLPSTLHGNNSWLDDGFIAAQWALGLFRRR